MSGLKFGITDGSMCIDLFEVVCMKECVQVDQLGMQFGERRWEYKV